MLKNPKKQFESNIQEFDNLIKENQNNAKEINIGSNKVVLKMNEDTTKYKVSAQPSECGRQRTLNSVHGHTAVPPQSNGNLAV